MEWVEKKKQRQKTETIFSIGFVVKNGKKFNLLVDCKCDGQERVFFFFFKLNFSGEKSIERNTLVRLEDRAELCELSP